MEMSSKGADRVGACESSPPSKKIFKKSIDKWSAWCYNNYRKWKRGNNYENREERW